MPKPDLSSLPDLDLVVPEGYGLFRSMPRKFPEDLFDRLLIWEKPRPRECLYVASVDVGDGIGQDRSVVDITRVGTLLEPDEQVAQWVSAWTDPLGLAPVVDFIGKLYSGKDGQEALCAIECNNHGLVTQAELTAHYGYTNMFVWEYLDAPDPSMGQSRRIGWYTTPRTRPLILSRYLKVLKTFDPNSNLPDYRVNSPLTLEELRSFQTAGGIREAEADPTIENAHDDCIMAGAIGVWVSGRMQYSDSEPMDQARHRLTEQRQRQQAQDKNKEEARDYQNQDFTAEEVGLEEAYGPGQDTETYWD
jgi:hypothetical protein